MPQECQQDSERDVDMTAAKDRAMMVKLKERNNILQAENKEKDRINEDQEREITSLRSELSQLRKQRGLSHE